MHNSGVVWFGLYKSRVGIINEHVIVQGGAGMSQRSAALIQGGAIMAQHMVANSVITKNGMGMKKI